MSDEKYGEFVNFDTMNSDFQRLDSIAAGYTSMFISEDANAGMSLEDFTEQKEYIWGSLKGATEEELYPDMPEINSDTLKIELFYDKSR